MVALSGSPSEKHWIAHDIVVLSRETHGFIVPFAVEGPAFRQTRQLFLSKAY